MAPHRRLSLAMLLVSTLLLLGLASPAHAAVSNSTTDASSSSRDSSSHNNATITVSYCELCRDRGECDRAHMGSAGIFCGAHVGSAACCCPTGGVCLRAASSSANDCACGSKSSPHNASVKDQQGKSGAFGGSKIAWTVLTALVMCVLIAVYLYTTRVDRSYHYREPQRRMRDITTAARGGPRPTASSASSGSSSANAPA